MLDNEACCTKWLTCVAVAGSTATFGDIARKLQTLRVEGT